MPGFAGRQVGISLKGEASNHKGISGEQGTVGEEGRIRSLLHQIEESQAKLRNVIDRL
jgi:hypothetical protein